MKKKLTDGSSRIPPNRCLRKRGQLAAQLVDHSRPSTSDFLSGIAPSAGALACSWHRQLHSSRKLLHRELQPTPVLAEGASSRIDTSHFFDVVLVSHPHTKGGDCFAFKPICEIRISTERGSVSSSHRTPPSAPGGQSLNSLSRRIASCTSPISALGRNRAVVLTSKCFPKSSRNGLYSDLQPLTEHSSPLRLPVSNTDAEIAQRHSHQVHHIEHLSVERCSCISQSIHCFDQLVDLAIDDHKDNSCKR